MTILMVACTHIGLACKVPKRVPSHMVILETDRARWLSWNLPINACLPTHGFLVSSHSISMSYNIMTDLIVHADRADLQGGREFCHAQY